MSRTTCDLFVATAMMGCVLFAVQPTAAQLPVSGVPVPELSAFDSAMQDFMDQYELTGGVLAVSRNGCIVYQRGFGVLSPILPQVALPENTPMRIASCEKPITAAAIRRLISDGALDWDTQLFGLGSGNGVLNHTAFGGVGDSRLDDITIEDAFDHRGGWSRETAAIGDPQFAAEEIADAMNVSSPPGRDNTIRYMLGQPLQFAPGTNGCTSSDGAPTFCYSNFGYMCLGRVIENLSGLSYIDYVRQNILTPELWVPSTEVFTGRTFRTQQNPREPIYRHPDTCDNVFDPDGPSVSCPYGGWEHEVFIGHGNLVMSAAAMLVYMDHYQVGVGGISGTPLDGALPHGATHNGTINGTSSVMFQRNDGINIVVLFNERVDEPHAATQVARNVSDLIDDGGFTWPTNCVDGFWVDFTAPAGFEAGGYNSPFRSMIRALSDTTDGTKLRFKPGESDWSGTINERMRLDAPFGAARIGV